MILQLGNYQFSVNTAAFDMLSSSTEYSWQKQDVIGASPVYQYLGIDNEEIEISGIIYPYFNGGTGQIKNLKSEAQKAKPLLMNDGQGNILGKWLIKSISETNEFFDKNGVSKKIEFRIKLLRY